MNLLQKLLLLAVIVICNLIVVIDGAKIYKLPTKSYDKKIGKVEFSKDKLVIKVADKCLYFPWMCYISIADRMKSNSNSENIDKPKINRKQPNREKVSSQVYSYPLPVRHMLYNQKVLSDGSQEDSNEWNSGEWTDTEIVPTNPVIVESESSKKPSQHLSFVNEPNYGTDKEEKDDFDNSVEVNVDSKENEPFHLELNLNGGNKTLEHVEKENSHGETEDKGVMKDEETGYEDAEHEETVNAEFDNEKITDVDDHSDVVSNDSFDLEDLNTDEYEYENEKQNQTQTAFDNTSEEIEDADDTIQIDLSHEPEPQTDLSQRIEITPVNGPILEVLQIDHSNDNDEQEAFGLQNILAQYDYGSNSNSSEEDDSISIEVDPDMFRQIETSMKLENVQPTTTQIQMETTEATEKPKLNDDQHIQDLINGLLATVEFKK